MTCSSFTSICSITCAMQKVVKQEACSSGFAAIYITSERRLKNIVRATSESAPKKTRLKGEGARRLGEEGRSCLGSCLHGTPYTHTQSTCAVTGLVNISSYISTCFSLGPMELWFWGIPQQTRGVTSLAGSGGGCSPMLCCLFPAPEPQ